MLRDSDWNGQCLYQQNEDTSNRNLSKTDLLRAKSESNQGAGCSWSCHHCISKARIASGLTSRHYDQHFQTEASPTPVTSVIPRVRTGTARGTREAPSPTGCCKHTGDLQSDHSRSRNRGSPAQTNHQRSASAKALLLDLIFLVTWRQPVMF